MYILAILQPFRFDSIKARFRKNEAKVWHESQKIKVLALDWVLAKDMKNEAGFIFSEPALKTFKKS